ncbi:hypothetical protein [Streptacidiphilus sp. EB103A]|uniref:hypothetical protein n=1 Tax=Streptacidiphilus sp. EB103A TaxID=3156275 RepID=UPI003515464A
MWWCVQEFGHEVLHRPVELPGPGFFPVGYDGTPDRITELLKRVCAVMEVDFADLAVEYFRTPEPDPKALGRRGDRHDVGRYHQDGERHAIELDLREADDPQRIAGIFAHELGHKRLLGEGRLPDDTTHHERLTDLVTVFLGMGIFNANIAYEYTKSIHGWSALPLGDLTDRMLTGSANDPTHTIGYLNETEFGYALACYALLRKETAPAWAALVDPGPRAALRQGLRYFAREHS